MATRGEQRNQTDDKNVEYQVFGIFKSREKEPANDSGDKDHQWMTLQDMYKALDGREHIDALVTKYFESLQPAHSAAMEVIVAEATRQL